MGSVNKKLKQKLKEIVKEEIKSYIMDARNIPQIPEDPKFHSIRSTNPTPESVLKQKQYISKWIRAYNDNKNDEDALERKKVTPEELANRYYKDAIRQSKRNGLDAKHIRIFKSQLEKHLTPEHYDRFVAELKNLLGLH